MILSNASSYKRAATDSEQQHPDLKKARSASWTEKFQRASGKRHSGSDEGTVPSAKRQRFHLPLIPAVEEDDEENEEQEEEEVVEEVIQPEPITNKRRATEDDEEEMDIPSAKRQRRPPPAWAMHAIAEGEEDAIECTICLEPITGKDQHTSLLPCLHAFHTVCIGPYYTGIAVLTCPNCRRSVTRVRVQGASRDYKRTRDADDDDMMPEGTKLRYTEADELAADPRYARALALITEILGGRGFQI